MKRTYHVILTIIFIFTILCVKGQFEDLNNLIQDIKNKPVSGMLKTNLYNDFHGSPYVQKNFTEGSATRLNGRKYQKIPLKYNGYSDRIEFSDNNGNMMYIPDPEEYKEFKIGDKKFIYLRNINQKPKLQGYFELLENGKIKLLKKYQIILKEAVPAQAYKEPKPAEFVAKQPEYYLITKGGDAIRAKNKKSILQFLSDKRVEMSKFISKNKLKPRKEKDLKHLINYYNEL